MPKEATAPPPSLMQMASGFWISQSVYVAAKLGLADLLRDGPRSSEELARQTKTDPLSLFRLLRTLASVGVFAQNAAGTFEITPLAQGLLEGPGSAKAAILMMGEEHYRSWGELLHCVRTGATAFEKIYGKPIFDYLSEHPEQAKIFDAAMTSIHGHETQAMIEAYDFAKIGTLVDVGGGNGGLLCTVLEQTPGLRGVLYDLPSVVERATKSIEARKLSSRCSAVGGSFFESVPAGGDAYLLRHIIHDWYDDKASIILKNCRKAMKPEGRLLVIETVVPPGNDPGFVKLLDLNMLVIPGGMERTEEEYRSLYASCGFRLDRVIPTRAEVSILEGTPI